MRASPTGAAAHARIRVHARAARAGDLHLDTRLGPPRAPVRDGPQAHLAPTREARTASRRSSTPRSTPPPAHSTCSVSSLIGVLLLADRRDDSPRSSPTAPGPRDDPLGAAPRPRRPREPVSRSGDVRRDRRRDQVALVRTTLARLRSLRRRDPLASRPLDPLHDRRTYVPRPGDQRPARGPLSRCRDGRQQGRTHLGAVRRAPQEATPVRALDPDEPQLRARVRRVARCTPLCARPRDDRPTRPHPGARVHRPARAPDAQEARARPPARRPSRPRRARHRLRRRSQGAEGRARSCSIDRSCTSTCASSAKTRPR